MIVLLMLSNAWAIFFLMNEKQPAGNREEEKPQGMESGGGVCDIMGPSRFRMPERTPQAARTAPNAATELPSEAVDEKDVTFADESEAGLSRQVPNDKLDERRRDHDDQQQDAAHADRIFDEHAARQKRDQQAQGNQA